jgi:hypothetical protein
VSDAIAPRIIGIDGLHAHLRALLGADSLLFRRLERALSTRDPERVAAAIDALALYPADLRRAVEDFLLAWLLEGRAEPPRGSLGLGRPEDRGRG